MKGNGFTDKLIYIENESTDPHYNLAFEEYVFRNTETLARGEDGRISPVLLLWRNAPSVIIGKYQNTIEEIDYDYISANDINVVRRNTGGGAVYHDLGNLNYSFIIPGAETKVDFGTFTTPLVKALNSQGVPAQQAGRNDILVDGKKFSGNAQQFSGHNLLHHGTIMFDVDTEAVAKALRVKPGKFRSKATKSVRSRVTNLKPYFDQLTGSDDRPAASDDRPAGSDDRPAASGETGVSVACGPAISDTLELKSLLLEWFNSEYEITEVKLTDEQLAEIEALKQRKYDTYDWNFGRSPKADIVRGDFFRCGYVEFHFTIKSHKVENVKIHGDFFSTKDIEELERALEGCDYTAEALGRVLDGADLEGYLGDVTAEELLAVIV